MQNIALYKHIDRNIFVTYYVYIIISNTQGACIIILKVNFKIRFKWFVDFLISFLIGSFFVTPNPAMFNLTSLLDMPVKWTLVLYSVRLPRKLIVN